MRVSGRFPKTILIASCVKDMASNFGWMAPSMKAGSQKIARLASVVSFTQMATSMRESGRTIKQRETAPTLVKTAPNM